MEPYSKLKTFLILEELGHGGMGGVYVGYDYRTHQLVAVKTLFQEFTKEEDYVKRFQREANVYKSMEHPNIVGFVDSGIIDTTHFIALEFIRGKPLDDILKEEALEPRKALDLFITLTRALGHAHKKGVIHRDLKPQNVVISENGVLKLLDFGVARADDDLVKTVTGSILGTFFYSSPEQNQGKKIDSRSDLYSLGLVFYEMLTGKRALAGGDLLQVTMAQMKSKFPPPSEINQNVPKGFDTVVMKLLQKSPDKRYQDTDELLEDLDLLRSNPAALGGGAAFSSEEAEALWEKAKAAYAAKDFDTALHHCDEIARNQSETADLHVLRGKCYAGKDMGVQCIEQFKKAIGLAPHDPQYILDYGIALVSLKMYDHAKVVFKRILSKDPTNPYANRYMHLIKEAKAGGKKPARRPARRKVH